MRKIICILMLAVICLTGCSKEAVLLKPYAVASAAEHSDANSMLSTEVFDGIAQQLGVVSVADSESGYNTQAMIGIDATEIFLASVDDPEVVAASNVFKQMPPASITKILTILVALENVKDLDQEVTLNNDVVINVYDAQVCGFVPGDKITLRDLIYCTLIYSGNDAANAVASFVGGDIPTFCDMMNERAAELGANKTHFVTPNGLDEAGHVTTAYDIYLIFRECLKYDVFLDAVKRSSYSCSYIHNGVEVSNTWPSTNCYLIGYSDAPEGVTIIGGKTGNTTKAGRCLVLYAENEEEEGYIAVLLGCPDKDNLYACMSKLLSNIRK